jgi:hypothetical protein
MNIVFYASSGLSVACWRTQRGQIASRVISVRQSVFSLSVSSCLDQVVQPPEKLSLAAVNAIELIDFGGDLAETNYAQMIQMFHRFLLDHLAVEEGSSPINISLLPPDPPFPQHTAASLPITQLLGMYSQNIFTCTYCKTVRENEQITSIIDLIYPPKVDCEPYPAHSCSHNRLGSDWIREGIRFGLTSVTSQTSEP